MTTLTFRVEPRKGQLDRVKRIYCYLAKFKHVTIQIRTKELDMSELLDQNFD